ncbi:MAG: hypothetical protein ACRED7_09415 [Stellaceae bacterium]
MGADFIQKAAKTFKTSWDRGRVAVATADLFTRTPGNPSCVAAADIVGNAVLKMGEHLNIELVAGNLIARRGITEVARFSNPSAEILKAVDSSCGIAKGTVEQVHDVANVVEISLC